MADHDINKVINTRAGLAIIEVDDGAILFMNEHIAGIDVDPEIVALYEGADRARGEEIAERVSMAVAREIAPYIDGFYLMTPFGRTGLMARIMGGLKTEGLAK